MILSPSPLYSSVIHQSSLERRAQHRLQHPTSLAAPSIAFLSSSRSPPSTGFAFGISLSLHRHRNNTSRRLPIFRFSRCFPQARSTGSTRTVDSIRHPTLFLLDPCVPPPLSQSGYRHTSSERSSTASSSLSLDASKQANAEPSYLRPAWSPFSIRPRRMFGPTRCHLQRPTTRIGEKYIRLRLCFLPRCFFLRLRSSSSRARS